MAYKVSVDIDLGAIQQEVMSKVFPVVTQAVAMVAEEGANQWRSAVKNAKIAPYEKSAYVDSINWKMTGGFSAEISSDYSRANDLERGTPSWDMKKVLQTSQRTRVAKSGKHAGQKYLIIPFRHNIPGNTAHAPAMPANVYKAAKQLSTSNIVGKTSRMSGTGHTVPQSVYSWGSRLPPGMMPKAKPHHATDLYSGMYRFNSSAGNGKSSIYLTMRVMGEWSTGWIYPAKPGLFIARDIAEKLQPLLEKSVSKAVSMS